MLPTKKDIVPVLATIVFVVFSWSIYRIVWYVPSWIKFLSIEDILVVLAYILAFALFESGIILSLLLFLAALLPGRLLKDRFVEQGSLIVWSITVWITILHWNSGYLFQRSLGGLVGYGLLILVVMIGSIIFISYIFIYRLRPVKELLTNVAERMTIFLYIYIPVSLLGMVIVIVRNVP